MKTSRSWSKWIVCIQALLCLAVMDEVDAQGVANYPTPVQGDVVLKDFRFANGESMQNLRLHYRTVGSPVRDARGVVTNAVLVLHGTGGSGAQFIRPEFANRLFAPGGVLDAAKYYIVLPDGIGHGDSSKPSDGMHARFPHYGYPDMIDAQYRLLTEGLGINHLRLVMGTSMGGMQTWLWGERHPDFMDALMPLASLPAQISGRNRVWRRVVIDAIRSDPEWKGGDYTKQPKTALGVAEGLLFFMSSNPPLRQSEMPTLAKSDAVLDDAEARMQRSTDVNDLLYQLESSRDYDPGPDLEKIRAPLFAVNSADDLINPPELGILEREIVRVPHAKYVIVPLGPTTRGHGTHTIAVVWDHYLAELLASAKPVNATAQAAISSSSAK
jgi:homoserine O-acetyltransferase/O-succinyltransferase